MNRTARPRPILAASLAACLVAAAACSNPGSPLGGECLRSDDCEEGACVALRCRLLPTDPRAQSSGGANAYVPPATAVTDASATNASATDAGASATDAGASATDAGASATDAGAPSEADAAPDAGQ
jgi:hypothetical protein